MGAPRWNCLGALRNGHYLYPGVTVARLTRNHCSDSSEIDCSSLVGWAWASATTHTRARGYPVLPGTRIRISRNSWTQQFVPVALLPLGAYWRSRAGRTLSRLLRLLLWMCSRLCISCDGYTCTRVGILPGYPGRNSYPELEVEVRCSSFPAGFGASRWPLKLTWLHSHFVKSVNPLDPVHRDPRPTLYRVHGRRGIFSNETHYGLVTVWFGHP
eukprot:1198020-Rhodomonas_salina.1